MATILVVDDNATARELLVTVLGYAGHTVIEAGDGAEALPYVRSRPPDLIIADLLMPTMDGFELVRKLREDPAAAAIPVVFYTATYLQSEAESLARACGVSQIITKPAEPETILQTVAQALGAPSAAAETPHEDFDREHMRLLTFKLSQRAELVVSRLSAVIELGLLLASERDPRQLLEKSCASARKIIGAHSSAAGILSDDVRKLRHFITSGLDEEAAAGLIPPLPAAGMLGEVLRERRARRAAVPEGPETLGLSPEHPPVASFLAAPIVSPGRVYGWFCLLDKVGGGPFSEEDERLTGILAAQVGRVYENGALYGDAQRRADALEREMAERKRAEAALRESERQFRAVFESSLDAMVIVDDEGRYLDANPAACALFMATREQMLGRLHSDFAVSVPDIEDLRRRLKHEGSLSGELRLTLPGGVVRDLEYVATADFLPGRHLANLRDITARKILEAQFLQAQKMEAVGRLAGGVAHDFNNILNVIRGHGELALRHLDPEDPLRRRFEETLKVADRGAGLTRQLLAFGRKQVIQPQVLDLNGLVSETEQMIRRLIGEDVELVTILRPFLGHVKADAGQIQQIMMNLVVNARDAMPRGGRIVIETRNTDDERPVGLSPGSYVSLSVADTGTGMNTETQAHIFEPFYTTKEPGKGTGLGLATVYGIVQNSLGHIRVESEPGKGSRFSVFLPRVEEPLSAAPTGSMSETRGGTETILLVEDQDELRAVARETLDLLGYHVLEAGDPEEALRIGSEHPGLIHLMLTDVVMPGASGPELSARLARRRPEMRILYMSGYADDVILAADLSAARLPLLQKPFSIDELAQRVRQVLDSASEGVA